MGCELAGASATVVMALLETSATLFCFLLGLGYFVPDAEFVVASPSSAAVFFRFFAFSRVVDLAVDALAVAFSEDVSLSTGSTSVSSMSMGSTLRSSSAFEVLRARFAHTSAAKEGDERE